MNISDLSGKVFAEGKRKRGKEAMDPPVPGLPSKSGGRKDQSDDDAEVCALDEELTGGDLGKDMACEDIMAALESKNVKALRAALDDYFGASK